MNVKSGWFNLKFMVFLLAMFLMNGTQAQTNCDSAIDIQVNSADTFYIGTSDLWFRFQATSEAVNIVILSESLIPQAQITGLEVFGESCEVLNQLDLAKDSLNGFYASGLIVNDYYFIRIIAGDSTGLFLLSLTESNPIKVYFDFDCNPECNNIIFNWDFEKVLQQVLIDKLLINGSWVDNPLHLDPFNINGSVQDILGLVSSNLEFYTHMVCQWESVSLSPQIIIQNNSKVAYNFRGQSPTDPEAIAQSVFMKENTPYTIDFDFSLYNQLANNTLTGLTATAYMYGSTTPNLTFDNANNILICSITGNTNSWSDLYTYNGNQQYIFTPPTGQNIYGIIIFPEYSIYPGALPYSSKNHLYIDNIKISPPPPLEPPIVTAPDFICPGTTSITYTITNYDPVYIYQYKINGGAVQIAPGNTFVVDLSNFSYPRIDLEITNWCENYGYHTAYYSCDPSTSIPVTMDYTFDHGDVITQQLFTNDNIFICGHVTIDNNVTFDGCALYFAPMARLIVNPLRTLTIENSSLTDGCDYLWDGVFAETPDASIVIQDSSFFKLAKNAVVSANNASLIITDSEFEDNIIGVHVRKYNPFFDPLATPDPPITIDPNATYIAGTTFRIVNSNITTIFSMELQSITTPTIGIKTDTIYNILIGDESNLGKRNFFDNLIFGIYSTWSDITVINCQFDNIGEWNSTEPVIDAFQRPQEGAIYCSKSKLPVGYSSNSMYQSPITPSAIIGGYGLKANYFNECKFGIYAYQHKLHAINNQFEEQYYNAVISDEGKDNCKVNLNSINMKDGVWAQKKFNNVSILFTRAVKPLSGLNTDIIGNTIHNTRIGIYAVSHSSNPQATCIRCTKIGSNQIYFNNTLITDGSKSYYGIELLNGDYARVAGNHIENQATAYSTGGLTIFPPFDSVLTGINIAQSKDAWIYDNHQIIKMSQGIRAVGVCTNTQFSCNDLITCRYGFYFYPNTTMAATFISHQGWSGRASDNYWIGGTYRVDGGLNMALNSIDWYFRGDDVISNPYSTFIPPTSGIYSYINPQPNTDVNSTCVGLPFPGIGDDPGGEIREMRYGDIVREQLTFEVMEEEFEQMSKEYLYEILYTNPDVMNIGQPGDTLYLNFYNYLTNSTIAEFTTIRELMDEENFAQALLDNGQVIAATMIDQNRQLTNDIYLRSVAVNAEIDSSDIRTLLAIALLTPYIGGDGVYAARAMLGIDPDDYGLAYRKGNETQANAQKTTDILVYPNPAGESITFEIVNEELQGSFNLRIFSATGVLTQSYPGIEDNRITISIKALKPGIYYYQYTTNSGINANGRFVKQ